LTIRSLNGNGAETLTASPGTRPFGCARREAVANLLPAPGGWRFGAPEVVAKLAASLTAHGQLRPLLARAAPDGSRQVIEGRLLLAAMRELDWNEALVVDVGAIADAAVVQLGLSLDLHGETDHAALAGAI